MIKLRDILIEIGGVDDTPTNAYPYKLVGKLNQILNEIGEGSSEPFKYKLLNVATERKTRYIGMNIYNYLIYGVTSKGKKTYMYVEIIISNIDKPRSFIMNDLEGVPMDFSSPISNYFSLFDYSPDKDTIKVMGLNFHKGRSPLSNKLKGSSMEFGLINDTYHTFRLMATLKLLVDEYIRKEKPDYFSYASIGEVKMGGSINQRDMLYRAFFRRNLPNAQVIPTKSGATLYKLK